ncbi:MAG: SDR family oxidoreductase [Alistipes sp.]|nr:SDR family oxidoreductase [Alistipes sp.]
MSSFKQKRVLITGGGSGIGRLMGRMSLEKGAEALIIWDINQQSIDATVAEFSSLGRVVGYRVNVADDECVAATYARVKQEVGDVDILINCAGIVTGNATFDKVSASDIHRTMNINATAPMIVALNILPDMVARNEGHICTIASAGGLISNPRMAVYAASKWAVTGWSDSVRIELRERGSNVRVTTVAPYYINTGMFDGVQSRILPILKPEYAARTIIRAIERNTDFKCIIKCVVPLSLHFIRLMQGILPTAVFDWLFGRVFGIYKTMDNFTGRK